MYEIYFIFCKCLIKFNLIKVTYWLKTWNSQLNRMFHCNSENSYNDKYINNFHIIHVFINNTLTRILKEEDINSILIKYEIK